MNSPKFLSFYDETVDALLAAGHEVLLGFNERQREHEAISALDERPLRPHVLERVPRRARVDHRVARELRRLVDFARYLDPRFAEISWMRENHRARLDAGSAFARRLA